MADEGLKEAWNYPDRASAEVGKYRLAEKGIEAVVFGDKVDSLYLTAIGGISLMVKRDEVADAKKILIAVEEVPDTIVSAEEEIGTGSVYCPKCHSMRLKIRSIRFAKGDSWLKNALKRVFGYGQAFHCRGCGYGWGRK
jgi:thioredoxin reductase